MAHPGGRPLKFPSVEELNQRIDEYFETDGKEFPTITGLAVYLDTSRRTLLDYREKPEYTHSLKRALTRCELAVEQKALTGKANPTMAIFTLKNNYGWVDKTETDVTSKGEQITQPTLDPSLAAAFAEALKKQQ